MATVSFLVESFVKANISSIIGLISTVIIMVIGYKLNSVLHTQPSTKTCVSISTNECSKHTLKDDHEPRAPIYHDPHGNQAPNSPHHRRNRRICSCECPYNKISLSSIYKSDYAADLKSMDNIHRLLTSELLDILISGFVFLATHDKGLCISSDILSLITLYCTNHEQYTQVFIVKGSHKGRLEWLNKIECINLNYKVAYNINIYSVNAFGDDDSDDSGDDGNALSLSTMSHDWDTEENGVCFVPNINIDRLIPNRVIQQMNTMYEMMYNDPTEVPYVDTNSNNNNNKYNAIFKCAGMQTLGSNLSVNSKASMIVFKANEWSDVYHDVIGFEMDLPSLPRSQTFFCAQTVYSSQYGLITNCRYNTFGFDIERYVSEANADAYDSSSRWNEKGWNRLRAMNHRRNWASSLCVIDNDRKLFICSGQDDGAKSVEIYNIAEDQWYDMADMNDVFVMKSGIYYDYVQERVIVGGGYKTERTITCYDIAKDRWMDLPNTHFPHSAYPSIWCNKFVINNVLYIAGNSRNDLGVLEFLDLRESNGKWKLASDEMQLNQYIETPQVYKRNHAAQMSNHHREESNHYPMQIRRAFV